MGGSHTDRGVLQERTRPHVRGTDHATRPHVHGQPAGPAGDRGPERRTADGFDPAHPADDVEGGVWATRLAGGGSSSTSAAGLPISQIRSEVSDIASAIAGSFVQ